MKIILQKAAAIRAEPDGAADAVNWIEKRESHQKG